MKNYIGYAWILTLSVIMLSVGAHYIPTSALERFGIHSLNILSALDSGETLAQLEDLDGEYNDEMPSDLPEIDPDADTDVPPDGNITTTPTPAIEGRPLGSSTNPIIDFSSQSGTFETLFAKMRNHETLGRPIRIGVLGDSFIEGDILTADLREMLQERFGGGGVGFVGITSQTAAFRKTVTHTFSNWTSRSIINTKANNFLISGHIFTPAPGSSYVKYSNGRGKKFIDKYNSATLIFTSTSPVTITVTVNDTIVQTHNTIAKPQLQKITTLGPIRSVSYRVDSVSSGFTAYGTILEKRSGISVDNFSVRGHSGTALTKLNTDLNLQFAQIANYDLLILQYGLNVARASVVNYVYYQKQMIGVINHIKECYPNVPIMLMSVSDRSTRLENSEWATMPGIIAMVKAQKQIAAQSGVAFWDTYAMMQSLGGMSTFVSNSWAAKDYTHIGPLGGKKVAASLFEALMSAKQESDVTNRNRELYKDRAIDADFELTINPRLPTIHYRLDL